MNQETSNIPYDADFDASVDRAAEHTTSLFSGASPQFAFYFGVALAIAIVGVFGLLFLIF